MDFVHLHVHSHYSLLDGLPKIDQYIKKLQQFEMHTAALTDHGNMYGAVDFYNEAKGAGIKPIIGLEAYLALNKMTDKRPRIDDDYFHFTLLAKDYDGYKNLMKITSRAHVEGFYYKPRADKDVLRQCSRGVIALSGCLRADIPRLLLAGKHDQAYQTALEYIDIFGKENFYIEIQMHETVPEQMAVNPLLVKLAQDLDLPLVGTTDSHYLDPEDVNAQDVMVCINSGKVLSDPNRLNMTSVDLSLKSKQQIEEMFKEYPEAVSNTCVIAERCNVEIGSKTWIFPKFDTQGKTSDEYLHDSAYAGIIQKHGEITPEEAKRLDYELDIIKTKGYATYFLIVADYVNWARGRGIVTTTRGSAAGSFVSYAIGIITVNPLIYKLPFERFLNPLRPSAPDIDVDIADNKRDEVLAYVRQKYGDDHVAQIVTFGTMMARAAVRDVTRAMGYPYSLGDKIAKLIPMGSQGFHMTIDRGIEETPELKEFIASSEDAQKIIAFAKKIEGCVRHASVHAAGVVISPEPLTEYVPLQREPGGDNIITQYDMHAVEFSGLVKMDFLGIRNLSILGEAVKIIKATKGVDIDITRLPMEDKKTFELLARGDTMGVFQLSGSGMTKYLRELKPTKITDIMAMVALFRPGPMESIPEFIKRKHNPSLVSYIDPRLKDILEASYGIITYQDDVLLIAIHLAGYNWEQADKLRKAMGKKVPEVMQAEKEKLHKGFIEHGLSEEKAEQLWKLIEPFAAYGFNKSHAASYGIVAYQTAYLKANFPAEFMTAVMTAESGDNEEIAAIIAATKKMSIEVLPPDVNESRKNFTFVDDTHIRFGLLAIKNVGDEVIDTLIAEREAHGKFKDISDLLARVKTKNLNKKSLDSFIKVGALDAFGDRRVLLDNMDKMLAYHKLMTEEQKPPQVSLFSTMASPPPERPALKLEVGMHATKEEKLAWEYELLGLYVSDHPFQDIEQKMEGVITATPRIREMQERARIVVAGVISAAKPLITKSGDKMFFVKIEDTRGSCEVIVFPKVYAASPTTVELGNMIAVSGTVSFKDADPKVIAEKIDIIQSDTLELVIKGLQSYLAREGNNSGQSRSQGGFGGEGYTHAGGGSINRQSPRPLVRSHESATRVNPAPSSSTSPSRKYIAIALDEGVEKTIIGELKSVLTAAPAGGCQVCFVIQKDGTRSTVATSYSITEDNDILEKMKGLVGSDRVKITSSLAVI